MKLYEKAGVDFLEMNESCPNTHVLRDSAKYDLIGLKLRLRYVRDNFLDQRERKIPVIVKLSNDTSLAHLPEILDILFELGYDGVDFGNASIAYDKRRELIDLDERKLFDFYKKTFGGSVSGRPLKESSLELASNAVKYVGFGPPSQEFHVTRTGGIETLEDIKESEKAGISLNRWFTGYFENFAKHGHEVYSKLLDFS